MKNNKTKKRFWYIFFGVLYSLGILIFIVADWISNTLGTTFQQLLYTLAYPLDGSDNSTVIRAFKDCSIPIVLCIIPYVLVAVLDCKYSIITRIKGKIFKKNYDFDFAKLLRRVFSVVCVLIFVGSLFYTALTMQLGAYIKSVTQKTTIYEEQYVDPDSVSITSEGETKNLVYIYLESMETAYTSKALGGNQEVDLIPYLTKTARNNISFSNNTNLGGAYPASGTTWTMAAIFALNSGLPFSFPVGNEGMSVDGKFAKGVTALGDILAERGYVQEFLCGSDAVFGGRKSFFVQHGDYIISDYFTAIEQEYIAPDYHVFWGHEDNILYKRAKDSLTSLYESGKPFNFTMLTVDTHFPDGYICDDCLTKYGEIAANAIDCADRQLEEFMSWCEKQPWYDNTVFVIVGDHPRMDTRLVEGLALSVRTTYNAIINAETPKAFVTQNRSFTQMDMFPTVLSAMGFKIEGERLGLGTNLFSDKPTLAEELGFSYFNSELGKYSKFYVSEFS